MNAKTEKTFFEGKNILEPLFNSKGFKWVEMGKGNSSGGYFISGRFIQTKFFKKKYIEIHFQYNININHVKFFFIFAFPQ